MRARLGLLLGAFGLACHSLEPFEGRLATSRGQIFVRCAGQGPDVVLLHGLGDSSLGWHKVEDRLREAGFRVTVWDALGAGRSDTPARGGYDLESHVDRLIQVMDRLDIEKAALVGNSYGGAMALLCALFHPERVSRLVLASPAAYPEGGWVPSAFFAVPDLTSTLLERLPPEWIATLGLRMVYGDPSRVSQKDLRLYTDAAKRPGSYRGLIGQQLELMPGRDKIERWVRGYRSLNQPALILWGSRDRILAPALGRRLAADLPDARLVTLDGVGHAPQLEAPERFLAPVLPFLRDQVDESR